MMQTVLMAIFPGDPAWLWRRASCLASVIVFLYSIVIAAHAHDGATLGQCVTGLLGVLGIYMAGGVTDDHLKRKAETP